MGVCRVERRGKEEDKEGKEMKEQKTRASKREKCCSDRKKIRKETFYHAKFKYRRKILV